MSYRRFRLADVDLTAATVATLATVGLPEPKSVATVATVAAPDTRAKVILSAYRRLFELCARGAAPRRIDIVERFLRYQFIDAKRLGWGDVELFGCYPDPALAAVRYDCMGAVTIAVLTLVPIATVSETEIRGESGLASRRPLPCHLAVPVWRVFPTILKRPSPMRQSRAMSLIEAVANIVIDYGAALVAQLAVFPIFDLHVDFSDNLLIGAVFTAASLARSYLARRAFQR